MKQFLDWHWAEYERGNRPSHYEIAQWCAINGLPIEKSNIVESYNEGFRDGESNADSNDKRDISEFSNAEYYYENKFKK